MSQFTYDLHVELTPAIGKRGTVVQIRVQLNQPTAKVNYVYVSVDSYHLVEVVPAVGDSVYELKYPIPWDTLPGNYQLSFYARNDKGEKGPVVPYTYKVE